MVASQDLADDIQRLVILETGYQAAVRTITPIDHPVYGQTVFRAVFDRNIGPSGTSAIVKRRREAGAAPARGAGRCVFRVLRGFGVRRVEGRWPSVLIRQ